MKLNLKKVRVNQVFVVLAAIVISLFLIRSFKKPEQYEGGIGPAGPSEDIKGVAKEKKLTQAELDAVLKFIA